MGTLWLWRTHACPPADWEGAIVRMGGVAQRNRLREARPSRRGGANNLEKQTGKGTKQKRDDRSGCTRNLCSRVRGEIFAFPDAMESHVRPAA